MLVQGNARGSFQVDEPAVTAENWGEDSEGRAEVIAARKAALERIPDWVWSEIVPFEERVDELKAFVRKYNEFPKHRGEREDGAEASLASFMSRQREAYKKDELPAERKAARKAKA